MNLQEYYKQLQRKPKKDDQIFSSCNSSGRIKLDK